MSTLNPPTPNTQFDANLKFLSSNLQVYSLCFICVYAIVLLKVIFTETSPTDNIYTSILTSTESSESVTTSVTFAFSIFSTVNKLVTEENKLTSDENTQSSSRTAIFISVGVIAAIIVLLIIILVYIRCFRNNLKSAGIKNQNATQPVTSQNLYDYADTANGELVVNEIYVSADVSQSGVIHRNEEAVYSTPMKKQKPKLVDNVFYKSFDGR